MGVQKAQIAKSENGIYYMSFLNPVFCNKLATQNKRTVVLNQFSIFFLSGNNNLLKKKLPCGSTFGTQCVYYVLLTP